MAKKNARTRRRRPPSIVEIPHISSELEGKFLGLARHAWNEPRAQALLQGLMSLDAVDGVAAFLKPFVHEE